MEFRVLGPLEVRIDGAPLSLGGPRQRALLAILLLETNRVVSRDRLIDELWGAEAVATTGHALNVNVARLRKALGAEGAPRLLSRAPGYVLCVEPGELDLERFRHELQEARLAARAGDLEGAARRLREGEGLWRGRPLADLEFEPFARLEVERLEELRLCALEERVDAELALGRHDALVAELDALVANHPLRERLRGQLMLALYRSGRQAEALCAYREGRALLVEQQGLDPSPRLQELERAILHHDAALYPEPGGGPVAVAAPAPAPAVIGEPSEPTQAGPPPRAHPVGRRRLIGGLALAGLAAIVVMLVAGPSGDDEDSIDVDGNAVAVVDLDSSHISSSVALRSRPAAAAAGAGSVWFALPDTGAVARVDRDGRAMQQAVAVGGAPSAIAYGGGAVWVTSTLDDMLVRIDPESQGVVQRIKVGGAPSALAVGRGRVWVANANDSTITRVNASTGAVVDTLSLGTSPTAVALAADAVWVASEPAGQVLRLDPGSGRVMQSVAVGSGPSAIAAGRGGVWVANGLDGTISRIDPVSNVVTNTIPIGARVSDLALVGRSLWVGDERGGTLTEVDVDARRVTRTLRVGQRPQALAALAGHLFAGVSPARQAHRGGTLRLLIQEPEFDSLDPATFITLPPTGLLGLTNDGLVTLNHVGGSAGLRVVPDLAEAVPQPTDGGTTYRFTLRRGIRYSTGRAVRARDIRYAFERLFRLGSPLASYYRGLVGAEACQRRPRSCELSQGIVTDDRAGTVTIRLRAADPDFLQKLAQGYTFAVPAGSAPREAVRRPLPATGPYMIASYRPGVELRMVRNPHFREWSPAAQPAGNPDVIVYRFGASLDEALTAIQRGSADWVLNHGAVPANRRRELRTRYASQTHTALLPGIFYASLNTRVPPFDDVRVRRALNYAVDRGLLARTFDALPTCHVIPPQLPGYSPYCPYTRGPTRSGAWIGPDLAKARRLIAASGTAGTKVTFVSDAATPEGAYVVALLRRLGFRASARTVPGRRYGQTISDSRNRVQISGGGWDAEYPAASSFFDAKLSCRAFRPASPLSNNDAEFCDHGIERVAERARRLASTDPHAAATLWEDLYRRIMDQAPWVPVATPRHVDFVSKRVGNYQFHPVWGMLVSQLSVR